MYQLRMAQRNIVQSDTPPEQHWPRWAQPSEAENRHLGDLLSFASANCDQHLGNFQRHRDAGIKNLVFIIVAESAVVAFFFTQSRNAALVMPVRVLLLYLSLAALLVGYSAKASCKRAFAAALENTMLTHKIIWAMGLTAKVDVLASRNATCPCPGPEDDYFFTRRWVEDTMMSQKGQDKVTACDEACAAPAERGSKKPRAKTTEAYVDSQLGKTDNTYFWAKVVTIVFALSAFFEGIVATFAVIRAS
jgi:hypothetical protein